MGLDLNKIVDNFVDSIKDRLKMGPTNVVGIDIGASAVKVAEMTKLSDGSYKLIRFGLLPLPEAAIIEDEFQKEDEIFEVLTQALKRAGITTCIFALGLSGPNTMARKLQLAGGDMAEIEDQVMWEVEQYVPFGLEQSSVSFHVIGENEGGGVDVFVGVAKNSLIERYKDLIERTKLKVKIIDINVIAMTNLFEFVLSEQLSSRQASHIFIDFGAQKTQFVIYRRGTIAFAKEMSIGGGVITEEVQRQLGVNFSDAEDLKIMGDENGNLPEEILDIIDGVLEIFIGEIKKTLDFYVTATSDESFAGGFVTGGGALVPGLLEGLEEVLGVRFSLLNPFSRLKYDKKKFGEEQIEIIASRGIVALGLAMRTLAK